MPSFYEIHFDKEFSSRAEKCMYFAMEFEFEGRKIFRLLYSSFCTGRGSHNYCCDKLLEAFEYNYSYFIPTDSVGYKIVDPKKYKIKTGKIETDNLTEFLSAVEETSHISRISLFGDLSKIINSIVNGDFPSNTSKYNFNIKHATWKIEEVSFHV